VLFTGVSDGAALSLDTFFVAEDKESISPVGARTHYQPIIKSGKSENVQNR